MSIKNWLKSLILYLKILANIALGFLVDEKYTIADI